MAGATCPACGKWYGRTEFPTCYDCGVKAGRVTPPAAIRRSPGSSGFNTSAPGSSPTPEVLPPLVVPPESPLAAVMLEVAVGSFIAVNWQKGVESLKVRKELENRCQCWGKDDDEHFTYAHIAGIFGVNVTTLYSAIEAKLEAERGKAIGASGDTAPAEEESLEPVTCWRLFRLTMDDGHIALKGSHGAIWESGTLEAECNGSRDKAVEHLSSRLVSNKDWPANDLALMPMRPTRVNDGCGIYGVMSKANLHDTGGSLREGPDVTAMCLAHGVVLEGADKYWLKSSEMTIEELFIECAQVHIDGKAGPSIKVKSSDPWKALTESVEPIEVDPAYEILAQELRVRYDCTVHLMVGGESYRTYPRLMMEVIDPGTVAPWLLAGLGYEVEDPDDSGDNDYNLFGSQSC